MNDERNAFPDSELLTQNPETHPADSEPSVPFVPPLNIPNIPFHRPAYRRQTPWNFKKHSDDPRVEKYERRIEKHHERERQKRRAEIADWWWTKGMQLILLVLGIISAVCSVIGILR